MCAFPGSLDSYFCDQNVPEPFLLKENWRQEFPNALPSLERRFSSSSDKAFTCISCRMLEAPPNGQLWALSIAMLTCSV